jgi:HipA-like C-terminal domain
MDVKAEQIKRHSDYQINWHKVIKPLRKGGYTVESTAKRSIHGDAPKSFICIKEYIPGHSNARQARWPGYIAKVGSKRYPVESLTEHLLTRIGQVLGAHIADSKLRMVAGQVRFLSKYFLSKNNSLVHGLEIFRRHLDDEMVKDIAEARQEQEFYTFQTVVAAINDIYPNHLRVIMEGMVEMLAFDAIVGNNDRHPLNWGVIVPIAKARAIQFAPIFDTARGMFWNLDDSQLEKITANQDSMEGYTNRSYPQIGWDKCPRINHFDLVSAIFKNYPQYRKNLLRFANSDAIRICATVIEDEFSSLMSSTRRHAIRSCLKRRHERYCIAIAAEDEK